MNRNHPAPTTVSRPPSDKQRNTAALRFVVFMGIISLFADMTYEGARSITGPFLALLGASAAAVGVVAGLGEFLGYALRFISGYWADHTKQYWLVIGVGFAINLLAVPLLALCTHWELAALLIVLERVGKAIRTPARDAMLAAACQDRGLGWGFGLHEAMDQAGAMIGPLLMAGVLFYRHDYHLAFGLLLIPALMALFVLWRANRAFPHPEHLRKTAPTIQTHGLTRAFWLYLIGAMLIAAGFADFSLMAYHFSAQKILAPLWIPITYAIAMGVDGAMSPVLGYAYDRFGFKVLLVVTPIAACFAPLVFLGKADAALIGVVLWAVGMGAHDSLMKAIVGNLTTAERRASTYGLFNLLYGLAWFAGSAVMGMIYNYSINGVVIFIVGLQVLALPWLGLAAKAMRPQGNRI